MFTGSCLCDQVRLNFEPKPTDISICHCTICRQTTGSAFGAYIKVASDALTTTHGTDQLRTYNVTDNLSTLFCGNCGSTLFAKHDDYPGFIYVSLGAMAEGSDIHPTYHEFVGSKADWFDIQDALPQHDEWSNSE